MAYMTQTYQNKTPPLQTSLLLFLLHPQKEAPRVAQASEQFLSALRMPGSMSAHQFRLVLTKTPYVCVCFTFQTATGTWEHPVQTMSTGNKEFIEASDCVGQK